MIALSLAAAAYALEWIGVNRKWWGPLILIVLCAVFLLVEGKLVGDSLSGQA